ncbi:MAG TPA: nuclear transport factor 2 family protein [Microlunatus sp.]|nr:nuclear transport factor 2 family protein [Microlunatus sp.]
MVDRDPAETVRLFDAACNQHDLEALAELITDDCVFEDTTPPDGLRHVGRDAVLEAFTAVMSGAPDLHFDIEEMVTVGDRVFVLWRYSWGDGHVRGVDVMRVRGDRVAESFAYVKG